ncbi:MAG: hypothetical protein AAGK21_13255 [Bacteroidota bacterium]
MSRPAKARGWRRMTVDGRPLRWRFAPQMNPDESGATQLLLHGEDASAARAIVAMPLWIDPWAHIGVLRSNDPPVVTARFASEAARAAIDAGWDPDARGPDMVLWYRDGTFSPAGQP